MEFRRVRVFLFGIGIEDILNFGLYLLEGCVL